MSNHLVHYALGFLLLSLISCHSERGEEYISQADSLIYVNRDSCLDFIARRNFPIAELHEKQEELIRQRALFYLHSEFESDSVVLSLADYFTRKKEPYWAGYTYDVYSNKCAYQGDNEQAARYMKMALREYEKMSEPPLLPMCEIYGRLGYVAHTERMFQLASGYFRKALEYAKQLDNEPLMAHDVMMQSLYSALSRATISDTLQAIAYADSALIYCPSQYRHLRLENEYTKYFLAKDDDRLLDVAAILCDSFHIAKYASTIAEICIRRGELRKAQVYLDISSQDTGRIATLREEYLLNRADLMQKMGDSNNAYKELRELYLRLLTDVENTEYFRSFFITEEYDAAFAREQYLEEKIRRQHTLIWAISSVLLLLILSAVSARLFLRLRNKLINSQRKSLLLEQESNRHRELLLHKLRHRLSEKNGLHQWDSFDDFYKDLDDYANGAFSRIKTDYPQLSTPELQYIALAALGYDISEICIMLDISKRTVYNRRQLIRQHLQLANDDLDSWIRQHIINK